LTVGWIDGRWREAGLVGGGIHVRHRRGYEPSAAAAGVGRIRARHRDRAALIETNRAFQLDPPRSWVIRLTPAP